MVEFTLDEHALMVRALQHAFREAKVRKMDDGKGDDEIRALLSKGIVAAAERGERDELHLAERGVMYLREQP